MTTIPRDTLQNVLIAWLVRICIMGIALYALNHWFGPFDNIWFLWPAYALFSLTLSIIAMRFKNRKIDELEATIDKGTDT